jgi:hypothetical protein
LVIAALGLSIWLPYHREQQAIQRIEGWGGAVGTWGDVGAPEWLRQLMSEYHTSAFGVFERVIGVNLSGTAITDADLIHLSD